MSKTIFEQIIDREIPAHILYEDETVIAFLDAFPLAKGHALVVPKKPIENIYELDDETGAHLMRTITRVANAIKKAFNPKGLNIAQNNGEFASQSVFHLHFHIVPRYENSHDGFGYHWVEDPTHRSDADKQQLAQLIKSNLDA